MTTALISACLVCVAAVLGMVFVFFLLVAEIKSLRERLSKADSFLLAAAMATETYARNRIAMEIAKTGVGATAHLPLVAPPSAALEPQPRATGVSVSSSADGHEYHKEQ